MVSIDSAVGLIYEGLPYEGHAQQVFAYYATPGILQGDKSLDKNLPAVVLVHGGGGRAFKEWAIMWAKKGYAAIAMDLRGNGLNGKHIKNGFTEENNETPYFKVFPALGSQWMYQAVADVILAHNLIRHFPEVDSSRTALTGISWGGVITCIAAGLDNRYKAAVPVYGCGYLAESGRMEMQLNRLSDEDRRTWIKQYDPSRYIGKAVMPVLFVNDANDPYFQLRSYMKTYNETEHKNLCIKINLKHSHHAGWSNGEIYAFINHYINHTPALPIITGSFIKGHKVMAGVRSTVKIDKVFLNYTEDTSVSDENRKWVTVEAVYRGHHIIAGLPPENAVIWYLSVEDERGLKVSGEVHFVNDKLSLK